MRVSFKTFGCRLNQYDTEWLLEEFELAGFEILPIEDKVDVCVINTCAVTSKTCRDARKIIRKVGARYTLPLQKSNKPFIIATGCYAKISPNEIAQIQGVNLIESDPQKIATKFLGVPLLPGIKKFKGHTKAFVKIQEGCDQFCGYCIVPYARGTPRERACEEILDEIAALIHNGYREFVLTGTNLGKCQNLLQIIKSIEEIPDVKRLGLGSIEPLGISDEFLEFIQDSQKFSKYFHIPLQSGDNKILKLMGRWYEVEEYETLLHKIKEKVPSASIGTDVIVGLPGEGEQEFLNTYNLIKRSPISRLHVFRYSKRPRIKASAFEGEPPEVIKKERSKIIRELGEEKWRRFRAQFIDKTLEAHIESNHSDEWSIGETPNYIKVLFKKEKRETRDENRQKCYNEFVPLRIKKIDGPRTYGELIDF